jgi:predicted phosphodiesterase
MLRAAGMQGPLLFAGIVTLLLGCPAAQSLGPVHAPRDEPWRPEPRESLRLVLVGDTGYPGPTIEAVRAAIIAETKDAVVALGDLVYPAPPVCADGRLEATGRAVVEARLGGALSGLGAPVLLAIGNHDVNHTQTDPGRLACLFAYAAEQADLVLPERVYTVDFGVALVAVVDTNWLTAEDAARVRAAFDAHPGWHVLVGHHVLKTYHDKVGEDVVGPWLRAHQVRPHIYANGHAHLLQLGRYQEVVAVTSGTGSAPRPRPTCPPDCGEGEIWGSSLPGYATLEIARDRVVITFKDATGRELKRHEVPRAHPPNGRVSK